MGMGLANQILAVDPARHPREDENVSDDLQPARRKPRYRKRLAFVVLLTSSLFWLNGPGLRMIGPWLAASLADRHGVFLDLKMSGTLLRGFVIEEVEMSIPDGVVERLTIGEVEPGYRWGDLLRGRIGSLRVRDLDAEIVIPERGTRERGTARMEESRETVGIGEMVRSARLWLIGMGLDVSGVSARVRGNGIPEIGLRGSGLRHDAGQGTFLVDLGGITVDGKSFSEPQRIVVNWEEEELQVARIAVHRSVILSDFALLIPLEGGLFAASSIDVPGARLELSSSPSRGQLALRLMEGKITASAIGGMLGVELPADGALTSFSLDVADLFPDPKAVTATVSLLVEDGSFEGYHVDEWNLDLVLDGGGLETISRMVREDAEIRLETNTTLDRETGRPLSTEGRLEVPSVDALARALDSERDWPGSRLDALLEFNWESARSLRDAGADVRWMPEEPDVMPEVALRAEWRAGDPVGIRLDSDGLRLRSEVDFGTTRYSGDVMFDGFEIDRYQALLAVVGIDLSGEGNLSATWRGDGLWKSMDHRGELEVAHAMWKPAGGGEAQITLDAAYDWPDRVVVERLRVDRGGQSVGGRVEMADGELRIENLILTDVDGDVMARAHGSLPVPEQIADPLRAPGRDPRPLDLNIETGVLDAGRLATWIPLLGEIDPSTTARVEMRVAGTFARPELDALFEMRGARAKAHPGIPPFDLTVRGAGRDQRLDLTGDITAPDFSPATMRATLPFVPAEWMEDADSFFGAAVEAAVVLPRIELSRFASMTPTIERLRGVIAGAIQIGGTVGQPHLHGNLTVTDGELSLSNQAIAPVTGVEIVVELDAGSIRLNRLRADIAGGALDGSGSYQLEDRELDFRMRGRALPLVRNESVIVRANTDLQVAGNLDQAAVTGSVTLVDSLFFRDIEILPIGTPFTMPKAAALPKIDTEPPTAGMPKPFADWALDVRLVTGEPLLIRGNLASGRVLADLRVGGIVSDPRPVGTVRLLRGRAVLPFSTLSIPEGVLTFAAANRLNPSIEIRGSAEPRPYSVNVYVYGKLSDPQIVLTSNPPLPENEIMTLLATGTTTRGLENPQMASARAIQLFAEEVRRGRVPMANPLRPLLGLLDRVDFTLAEADPYSSDTYSTATLKLHDRWYLSAGMSEEGNTRMFAIWRLRFR